MSMVLKWKRSWQLIKHREGTKKQSCANNGAHIKSFFKKGWGFRTNLKLKLKVKLKSK